MACFHPWVKEVEDGPQSLPCGRCIGCYAEYSRQWAVRIMDEASLHERNSFLSLTYDDAHVPADGSLRKREFPDFMARLRRWIAPRAVRYYHVGEYGGVTRRPHYHAVLFGEDFRESRVEVESKGDYPCWISSDLVKLWPLGFSMIGGVTPESAAYVSRYVLKRLKDLPESSTPDAIRKYDKGLYERVDADTGEVFSVVAEFATMSRRPGIGAGWLERFRSDVYPADERVVCGRVQAPPRYYDRRLEKMDPVLYAQVVHDRKARPVARPGDRSPERLHVREVCLESQLTLSQRGL